VITVGTISNLLTLRRAIASGSIPLARTRMRSGGGLAPKTFGTKVLEWVIACLRERSQVSHEQLSQPIRKVLPSWFEERGEPISEPDKEVSGDSFTIEATEGGTALAQQTIAL